VDHPLDLHLIIAVGLVSRSNDDLFSVKRVQEKLSRYAPAIRQPWTLRKLSEETDEYLTNHCQIDEADVRVIRDLTTTAQTKYATH